MLQGIAIKISDLCSQQPGIVAVYLFGSAAKDEARPSSDIDVAILLDDASSEGFPLLSFVSALERACGRRIDVVILNRATELLKYQVRRSGRLVFERDSRKRKRFEVLGRKRYEDFQYLHRKYVDNVLYGERHG